MLCAKYNLQSERNFETPCIVPWFSIPTVTKKWSFFLLQSTPDNSNLLGKSKKFRVIGSLKQITGNKDGEGMQLSNKAREMNTEFEVEPRKQ